MDETEKRIDLANRLVNEFKDKSLGIILAGSVAYSPYHLVRKDSDIDLVIVTENLKDFIDLFVHDESDRASLHNRFFEGYCFKETIEKIPVSYHILTHDAFDIITKCFVADIRVFRPKSKDEEYLLYGFERNSYNYWIKNVSLEEFKTGVRTIVPVGFINNDRYFLGIHRDKFLCSPLILHDTDSVIADGIDKLWVNICNNLCDESMRLKRNINLEEMNILNMLAKKDKMTDTIKDIVLDTTKRYIEKCLENRKKQ